MVEREVTGSFCPVSLTSIVCKVMESAMKEDIISHLLRTSILADAQHGFVRRTSYVTNLPITEQWISQLMDAHEPVDELDFSNAFGSSSP